jgi:16S rRNA C967 or C1407 C5-methylase (RsmB/RsmF family)/NOL1/NOP2/fmu family ribosome biogenesis protein
MTAADTLPPEFVHRMRDALGDECDAFLQALSGPPVVSVRYNLRKLQPPPGLQRVPWCASGYYLDERPSFTLDPVFHGGGYYVQEAASMFLEQAVLASGMQGRPVVALDLCAAPGGKSTHLASLLDEHSLLVSNETIQQRLPALVENTVKWGSAHTVITREDPSSFRRLGAFFDLVVVDAPCSGEGLFRKDPDSASHWSPEACVLCAGRQERILGDVLPVLKEGGLLVYSTCTYNPGENEAQAARLSAQGLEPLRIPVPPGSGILETEGSSFWGYACYPHRARGEGFFLSAFRKRDGSPAAEQRSRTERKKALPDTLRYAASWVRADSGLAVFLEGNRLTAFPQRWLPALEQLSAAFRIRHAGTTIGEVKGTKVIPAHDLAMSWHLEPSAFPAVSFSPDQALSYLRREAVHAGAMPRGWLLAEYAGVRLGWMNHLGPRTNNYYPVAWRIRQRA